MVVKAQLEAPDGGWGIMICFGMALPFISALGSLLTFGLVFGDFLKSIGEETSAIAFITGAFFCALSFAGLFSGALFKRYELRTIGLVGGALYFLGSVLQIFANSVTALLFAFSLLQGVGFGLIVPTSYTSFNNYFVKKRVVMMSFAQTLIGVGTMLYPVVMHKLLEWYGYRGCLAVLAAINAHAVLGMLVMQPVEWHMRRLSTMEQELSVMPATVQTNGHTTPKTTTAAAETALEDPNHLSPLMYSRRGSQRFSKEEFKMLASRSSSITSLGNWTGPIVVSDASPEMTHNSRRESHISAVEAPIALAPKSKRQIVVDFLDLTLLKKPVYVNIVLGITFALYSDIAFFTLQPMYLFEIGFSKPDTATIIAIGAAADLASRIFLALSAIFIQMPSRYVYLAGAFFSVIARHAFLSVNDFVGMACITAVMGFLRTWVHVPLPLVFGEYLPKERFASGYGLFMFLQGNIMFAISPAVGYLRDKTQDYILTFHVLNFFMVLCAVPWIIEIVCIKFRRKARLGSSVVVDTTPSIVQN